MYVARRHTVKVFTTYAVLVHACIMFKVNMYLCRMLVIDLYVHGAGWAGLGWVIRQMYLQIYPQATKMITS